MIRDIKRIGHSLQAALQRARASALSYTSPEALRTRVARDALRRVGSSSPLYSIFESIRSLVPFAAGMIEVMPTSRPEGLTDYVYNVPEGFLSAMARYIDKDPAPLIVAQSMARYALRGSDVIPDSEFYRLEYNQLVYGQFGLDNVTGMILDKAGGNTLVLWLFSGSDVRLPSWNECRTLELICDDIRDAVTRAKLPLVAHQSITFQIMQEQDEGYILLRSNGTLLEINRKGALLAQKYSSSGSSSWQREVHALISTAPAGNGGVASGVYQMRSRDGFSTLKLHVHRLPKESHALSEDVTLIRMVETTRDVFARLSPRQREVAVLLADSGLSYKQIADRLGIAYGTMCKFAERTYRNLNVHSRLELIALAANSANEDPTS